jgi:hypothetical protein
VLHFSEPAANLWYQYSQQLEQQMQKNGLYYFTKDHASKLLENTSRLAAILHRFEHTSDSNTEIDYHTLEFCWKFAQTCSKHFIDHLANEPQIVTDANQLAHYLLKTANDENRLADRSTNGHKDGALSHMRPSSTPPDNLRLGQRTFFRLSQVKQLGPSSLRGRANAERLEAAIELLTKLGHVAKQGSRYQFQESILLKQGEPEMKNGEIVTIKELPLFDDQVYWKPEVRSGLAGQPRYLIKVND